MDDLIALLMLLFLPTTVLLTVRVLNLRAARREALESAFGTARVEESTHPVGRF